MVVKYVCVATDKKLYLPYLQELLPELIVLGINTPWRGFITKYKLLQTYLSPKECSPKECSPKEISDDDLICFLDAYDVLPTKQLALFESKVRAFLSAQPDVKLIVGYDKVDNPIHEYLCQEIFGLVDAKRLNSGQFIGTAKHIREMINHIFETTANFQTDQIELTKYANEFKAAVHIDEAQAFFYVKSRPLQQVRLPLTSTSAFIHANGNGFLEDFLRDEHSIHVGFKERFHHFITNIQGLLRKIVIYDTIYIKRYMNWFVMAFLAKFLHRPAINNET
jgi:hypothetical protein